VRFQVDRLHPSYLVRDRSLDAVRDVHREVMRRGVPRDVDGESVLICFNVLDHQGKVIEVGVCGEPGAHPRGDRHRVQLLVRWQPGEELAHIPRQDPEVLLVRDDRVSVERRKDTVDHGDQPARERVAARLLADQRRRAQESLEPASEVRGLVATLLCDRSRAVPDTFVVGANRDDVDGLGAEECLGHHTGSFTQPGVTPAQVCAPPELGREQPVPVS
jgi:hypothetical protein